MKSTTCTVLVTQQLRMNGPTLGGEERRRGGGVVAVRLEDWRGGDVKYKKGRDETRQRGEEEKGKEWVSFWIGRVGLFADGGRGFAVR